MNEGVDGENICGRCAALSAVMPDVFRTGITGLFSGPDRLIAINQLELLQLFRRPGIFFAGVAPLFGLLPGKCLPIGRRLLVLNHVYGWAGMSRSLRYFLPDALQISLPECQPGLPGRSPPCP